MLNANKGGLNETCITQAAVNAFCSLPFATEITYTPWVISLANKLEFSIMLAHQRNPHTQINGLDILGQCANRNIIHARFCNAADIVQGDIAGSF